MPYPGRVDSIVYTGMERRRINRYFLNLLLTRTVSDRYYHCMDVDELKTRMQHHQIGTKLLVARLTIAGHRVGTSTVRGWLRGERSIHPEVARAIRSMTPMF
jgi:hypothetical protein